MLCTVHGATFHRPSQNCMEVDIYYVWRHLSVISTNLDVIGFPLYMYVYGATYLGCLLK